MRGLALPGSGVPGMFVPATSPWQSITSARVIPSVSFHQNTGRVLCLNNFPFIGIFWWVKIISNIGSFLRNPFANTFSPKLLVTNLYGLFTCSSRKVPLFSAPGRQMLPTSAHSPVPLLFQRTRPTSTCQSLLAFSSLWAFCAAGACFAT